MTNVGWIGLGAMGSPMASFVAKAGHAVTAFDIDPQRAVALAGDGVKAAATIGDAAADADVLVLMVATAQQAESVLYGDVVVGILSVQFGAGDRQEPLRRGRAHRRSCGCGWSPARSCWSLVARPALRGRTRAGLAGRGRRSAPASGLMNWAIYQSFARIPLGIAVTIEFVGPLDPGRARLAAAARPGLGGCSPALGVALLGLRARPTSPGPASLFALLAGAAWAAYILLSAQTGRRWPGLDGLAVASVVATAAAHAARAARSAATTCCDPRRARCSARRSGCSAR